MSEVRYLLLRSYPRISPGLRFLFMFLTMLVLVWGFVCASPNSHAGGSPLVSCPWLLVQCIPATLFTRNRSSIRSLRTRRAVMTGTHLSWNYFKIVSESSIVGGTSCNAMDKTIMNVEECQDTWDSLLWVAAMLRYALPVITDQPKGQEAARIVAVSLARRTPTQPWPRFP
jgi:hypothetical protein